MTEPILSSEEVANVKKEVDALKPAQRTAFNGALDSLRARLVKSDAFGATSEFNKIQKTAHDYKMPATEAALNKVNDSVSPFAPDFIGTTKTLDNLRQEINGKKTVEVDVSKLQGAAELKGKFAEHKVGSYSEDGHSLGNGSIPNTRVAQTRQQQTSRSGTPS